MYSPSNMKIENAEELHEFIEEYSFGVIISEPLEGSHLPFQLNRSEGEHGALYGHFAKANSQWKTINNKKVMIVFNGPHAYISPTWYAQAPAVPTWNYVAAHIYGEVEILDSTQTLTIVEQTMRKYEPSLLTQRNIVTDEFRDKLLAGIVGFKIQISHMEGKRKLGQHRKIQDQQGVVSGLQSASDDQSLGLVNYMLRTGIGTGH